MRIVYYTSGTTGVGRLVTGMAIGNALVRRGVSCDFTILHTSPLGHLAEGYDPRWVPVETPGDLAPGRWRKSVIYKTLRKLRPDVLLVNHAWFTLHHCINELPGKKYYLSDQAYDAHFTVPVPPDGITFDPASYDRVIAIEPFDSCVPMERVNPVILRNRDEILPREEALARLGLDGSKPVALYALSGRPDFFEKFREKYSYLAREGYRLIESGTYRGGIFPAVDYFNAFDLLVGGVGYNFVWEAKWFDKKAIFEVLPVRYSDQALRLKTAEAFHFDVNGADQLAEIIANMR